MLLAAGLGTRLRPLTELRPKPIVPVANRPLAAFAMEHLARSGVRTVVANTHPQPEMVESVLKSARPEGIELRFSREETLLGTGGGLRKAHALFDDSRSAVIVINGDTLFAPDLAAAVEAHAAAGAVATMILRPTPEPRRHGAIGIDARGRVTTLLGEPRDREVTEELMFTGVHVLSAKAFESMPRSGCVIRSAYRSWVDRGANVQAVVDDSPWADLGTIEQYHRLNLELASGSFPWPGVSRSGDCILPDGLEPTPRIRRSVIGDGARIEPDAELDRCVVWPGTTVKGSARSAVITPAHRIELDAVRPGP